MKWCKDPKIEHLLRSLGIKFETGTVKLEEIDRQLSADKQVRLGKKINEDWVIQYGEAAQQGSTFPMTVLNRLRKGYFIWSGNHRIGAAELIGEEFVDAYLVEVSDERLCDILPRVVNAVEAQGVMGKEEKLVHAKYMVDQHSMTVEDAARLMGLKPYWLTNYVRQQTVADKVAAQGVSVNGFTAKVLLALNPLADNANVLRATAHLLHKEQVVGREADQLIADVRSKDTELSQLAELARWEEIFKSRKARPRTRVVHKQPVRDQLITLLQRLAKLVEGKDTRQKVQLVDDLDYKLAKQHYRNLKKSLDSALGEKE